MKPSITIPLETYIEAIVGPREYGYINAELAGTIKKIPQWQSVCMVENSPNTTDWTGGVDISSPDLYRVWFIHTWNRSQNAAKQRQLARERENTYNEYVKQLAAEQMSRQLNNPMATVEFCKTMQQNLTIRQLEDMIVNGGGTLPVRGK